METVNKNTGVDSSQDKTAVLGSGIPKIIHQVWDSDIVPNEFVQNIEGLVKLNPPPEWQYYYWPLPVGKTLIERKYPALLKLFEASRKCMIIKTIL